jgi:CRP-like cAMP-binding protein
LPLPPNEIKLLLSKPTAVFLKHQLLIQEAGEQIKYCYFPNTSMISILTVMGDGKSIEVGLAGRESFVGAPLAVGFRTSAQRGVVQSEGTAYRIGAELFLEVLERCPQLNRLLIRNEYRRGKVHVLDRKRLERASCECYQIMKNQLETWDGETFRNRECN